MLYGIITEWNEAQFEGNYVSYDSVPDLAWKIWKLSPRTEMVGSLVMPSGFEIIVQIDGEHVALAIQQDAMIFEVSSNGAALIK